MHLCDRRAARARPSADCRICSPEARGRGGGGSAGEGAHVLAGSHAAELKACGLPRAKSLCDWRRPPLGENPRLPRAVRQPPLVTRLRAFCAPSFKR
mmetsp:Transcript_5905/g.12937  ORF Transcript_5905/g.12937 Transcript_5905/m.12937 type:complete len:97 (+) Transcript_5905:225-515(+)